MGFQSGKKYHHSLGLSCVYRQWRTTTHCRFLHGYALQVELEFERKDKGLDERNWVMGFGDLKPIKAWLEQMFDHKTLVANDDPLFADLMNLGEIGLAQVIIVDNIGTESFAKMIDDYATEWLAKNNPDVNLVKTRVQEHDGNWAAYSKD